MGDREVHVSVQTARDLAALSAMDPDADLAAGMQVLVENAQRLLAHTIAVSVTVRSETAAFTFAASDPLAAELDDRQYDVDTGPCTDALATGETTHASDLTAETRWPEWTPQAVAAGVKSMRSVPLVGADGQHLGALNCYGAVADGYAEEAVAQLADLLAVHACTLLQNLMVLAAARSLAEQLSAAMASRAVIEQAKGVFMSRLGVTADVGFDYLVKLSQHSHRKLRDVAAGVTAHASDGPGTDRPTLGDVGRDSG